MREWWGRQPAWLIGAAIGGAAFVLVAVLANVNGGESATLPPDLDDADIDAQLNHPHLAFCTGFSNNVFDSAAPSHDNNWTSRLNHATSDNAGHHHDIARSWR